MTLLKVAPDVAKRAYRMRCGFTVASGTAGRMLERATLEAGGRFIKDMQMRGYEWKSSYGYKLEGPFPHVEAMELKTKAEQARNPRDMSLVQDMTAAGDDDYRLVMTFIMPERIIQTKEDLCR